MLLAILYEVEDRVFGDLAQVKVHNDFFEGLRVGRSQVLGGVRLVRMEVVTVDEGIDDFGW